MPVGPRSQFPLSIWLLKGYFDAVSPEIEEAALVDGASRLRILWSIVAPIAMPGLIATGLLVFLQCWSEFFYANVLTSQLTIPPLLAGYNTPPRLWVERSSGSHDVVDSATLAARSGVSTVRSQRLEPRCAQVSGQEYNVSDVIRWGVIGSGGIARRRTIPEGIAMARHARLSGVFDVNAAVNEEVAAQFEVEAAPSAADLLRSDIDAEPGDGRGWLPRGHGQPLHRSAGDVLRPGEACELLRQPNRAPL